MSSRIASPIIATCLLIAGLPVSADTHRIAFVSLAFGSADIGSWPEAGDGLTGLDAADSICIKLAEDAGLANHNNFVAWMSDSADDAYCRVHNLTGKKTNNCGESELPAAAGPWVRTDGAPFGGPIEMLLPPTNEVYTSLHFDETGTSVPIETRVWTGTGSTGSLHGTTCADWTTTSAQLVKVGKTDRTSGDWGSFSGTTCVADIMHLFCLETMPGPPLVLPVQRGRLAFTTEIKGNGDLGNWPQADPGKVGIEAGDSICNNQAELAGLPYAGSYKAWLSDATTDARDRFVHDAPWVRLDGFQIASGIADLTDGALFTSNNQNEFGDYHTNEGAWTGTNADGTAHADHCDSWTSTSANGLGGRVNAVSEDWMSMDNLACSQAISGLHCLSDADSIFADGFEGDNP
jgi:hypothetical protein